MQWCPTPIPELPKLRHCPDQVSVFGVILHDVSHAEVRIALSQKQRWEALDYLTGSRWTIYAQEIEEGRGREEAHELREAMRRANLEDWIDRLPAIAVFLKTNKYKVMPSCVEPIDGNTVEKVYRSIKEILLTATAAIDRIDPENMRNDEDIFAQVNHRIGDRKVRRWIKKLVENSSIVNAIWGSVKK